MALSSLLPLRLTISGRAAADAADSRPADGGDGPGPARPGAGRVGGASRRPLLVVSRPDHATDLAAMLRAYLPAGLVVDAWPAPDTIPYERLPRDPARAAARLSILMQWMALDDASRAPRVLVVPARGLIQLLMPPDGLRAATVTLATGQDLSLTTEVARWVAAGYEPVSVVEEPGQLSRRGGILDLWPPTSELPVRIELGATRSSLRLFDRRRAVGRRIGGSRAAAGRAPLWAAARHVRSSTPSRPDAAPARGG
jgi:transcription-repair coupling factor (superfamily II helicase)